MAVTIMTATQLLGKYIKLQAINTKNNEIVIYSQI